ncbi:MAG: response regulator [Desulfovermiculus sp.]
MDEKTIFVIDDDQTIREILTNYLQELGYKVLTAADGLEGMDKIRDSHFDILLMDIRIPYVSGLGLLKIVQEIKPETPVICMTGYGASPERIVAEEDVAYIFSKPFKLHDLAQAIENLVPKLV